MKMRTDMRNEDIVAETEKVTRISGNAANTQTRCLRNKSPDGYHYFSLIYLHDFLIFYAN
jgi:hypothetical protein